MNWYKRIVTASIFYSGLFGPINNKYGDNQYYITAEENGETVGKLNLTRERDGTWVANMVEVGKNYRRRGIGTELFERAAKITGGMKFYREDLAVGTGEGLISSLESKGLVRDNMILPDQGSYNAEKLQGQVKYGPNGSFFILGRNTKEGEGSWRISYFDDKGRGFTHRDFGTEEEAQAVFDYTHGSLTSPEEY